MCIPGIKCAILELIWKALAQSFTSSERNDKSFKLILSAKNINYTEGIWNLNIWNTETFELIEDLISGPGQAISLAISYGPDHLKTGPFKNQTFFPNFNTFPLKM